MQTKQVNLDKAENQLLEAVGLFIEAKGGGVIVAGPIRLEQHPNERLGIYHVSIQCLGKLPPQPQSTSAGDALEKVLSEANDWLSKKHKKKKYYPRLMIG